MDTRLQKRVHDWGPLQALTRDVAAWVGLSYSGRQTSVTTLPGLLGTHSGLRSVEKSGTDLSSVLPQSGGCESEIQGANSAASPSLQAPGFLGLRLHCSSLPPLSSSLHSKSLVSVPVIRIPVLDSGPALN